MSGIPTNTPLYIFGASANGEALALALMGVEGFEIKGFIDNYKTGQLQGFPIWSWVTFLAQAPEKAVVLIAVAKVEEIRAGLDGFPGDRIMNAFPLAMNLALTYALTEKERVLTRTLAEAEQAAAHTAAWYDLHLRQAQAYAEVETWRVKALQQECFGEPEPCGQPVAEIPEAMLEAYAMGGLAKLHYQFYDDAYPANYPLIYLKAEVDAYLARIQRGERYYYDQTDLWIQEAMSRFPVRDCEVAVIGSRSPWFEAVCLSQGAQPITIEYNTIRIKDERLRAMTNSEWEEERLTFSHAVCISSIEHYGLGRYGDPLDPNGDLKAMGWLKEVVKPGGLLFLSVPIGLEDEVVFNVHRRYGPHRLPKLLEGWRQLGLIGWDGTTFAEPLWSEPVFILENL